MGSSCSFSKVKNAAKEENFMPFVQLDQNPPTSPDKNNRIEHSPTGLFVLKRVQFDMVDSDKSPENSSSKEL